ncbi:MAG: CopG family transcriptional regulator [Acidimicrobiales bacterium]
MPATPVHRRPGRPAVGVRVPVRLPPDVLDDIDRRARLLGRSRAAVIRSLLLEALGRVDAPDDGVDRAQIRRMLSLSPRERMGHMSEVAAQQKRIRGTARRPAR